MITDLTKLFLRLRPPRKRELPAPPPGVVLGHTSDGEAVIWAAPSAAAASHAVVLAASGTGKSVMLASALVEELAEAGERESALVVDPKGDLVVGLLSAIAATAPERLSDVRYLNPFGEGFAFNVARRDRGSVPADIEATALAGLVAAVSTATGAQAHLGVGARQLDVLTHLLLATLTVPDPRASVLLALDALIEPDGLTRLANLTTSERAKAFLTSAKLGDELRASTSARLRSSFAATDALETLVGAPTCISFTELLAPGRITLVDLGQPTGGLTSLQSFYANLLVRLAVTTLLDRPSPWSGHHTRVVIDEAQVVAPVLADLAEGLLTTGRSRGISMVAISQGTTLIHKASDSLLKVLLTNVPLKLVGRLAAQDAELLARGETARRGSDESTGAVRARTAAATANLLDREFFALRPGERHRFTTKDVDLAAWERARKEEEAAIGAARSRLALPPGTPPRARLSDLAPPKKKEKRSAKRREPGDRSRWG